MVHLIDKDALVAELKRLQNALQDPAMNRESMRDYAHGGNKIINDILSFIDTLEVKEVDLKKEIELEYNPIDGLEFEEFERIAKYFFELGLKATQKEE